ncbi:MAG: excinuclease ABC subunit UvrC [Negativicutes bacterium]|nr:excinuclease ABC subunit UvrC [Negativicutes bacterium]
MTEDIRQQIAAAPASSGVYFFRDGHDRVLYIGKAKLLNQRLKSYAAAGAASGKTGKMLERATRVDWIVTNNETEALLLEAQQIRQHRPEFNWLLKDDKNFPYIRVTVGDQWPALAITRKVSLDDGNLWLGPYVDGRRLRSAFMLARRLFRFRTCKTMPRQRACLQYQLGNCQAPCLGNIDHRQYLDDVRRAVELLRGRVAQVRQFLLDKIRQLADNWQFEEAERHRRWLQDVNLLADQSRPVASRDDFDCLAFGRAGPVAVAVILQIRRGQLINRLHFQLDGGDGGGDTKDEGMMQAFVADYYLLRSTDIPPRICLAGLFSPAARKELAGAIALHRRRRTAIIQPRSGERHELCQMAAGNAADLCRRLPLPRDSGWYERGQRQLSELLSIEGSFRRIECFDISHHAGTQVVAARAVMTDGRWDRPAYRRYKISRQRNDDFAALREVLQRRLSAAGSDRPDLIIIDGGKGQLAAVSRLCRQAGVPVIAIAKRAEEIFTADREQPIVLPPASAALHIVQGLRDQAHRLAVAYHRRLKRRETAAGQLSRLPGIGRRRAAVLLRHYGSLQRLREVSVEELCRLEGIGRVLAEKIREFFHRRINF